MKGKVDKIPILAQMSNNAFIFQGIGAIIENKVFI